jgi:hypothetical protein
MLQWVLLTGIAVIIGQGGKMQKCDRIKSIAQQLNRKKLKSAGDKKKTERNLGWLGLVYPITTCATLHTLMNDLLALK